jgi:hypothetical protein
MGFFRVVLVTAATGLALAACSAPAGKKANQEPVSPDMGGDGTGSALPPPKEPDITEDAGDFGIGMRSSDAAAPAAEAGRRTEGDAGATDAAVAIDAAPTPDDAPPPGDAPAALLCPPLKAGDLAIVEIMIASTSGVGDRGEWVEMQSTQSCRLNLNGLRIQSPRDTGLDYVDITADTLLDPNATFIVADSADPTLNNNLPGLLFSWNSSDVLKNSGDTVTLLSGTTTIDELTYPDWTASLQYGRTVSFPSDCTWADRSSWSRWSWSFNTWTGTLRGTPNAYNVDVACY